MARQSNKTQHPFYVYQRHARAINTIARFSGVPVDVILSQLVSKDKARVDLTQKSQFETVYEDVA